MIFRYTLYTLIIFILFYGLWYSYEFINPWIAIVGGILFFAFILQTLINKLKS
jgi:hypothetical protein